MLFRYRWTACCTLALCPLPRRMSDCAVVHVAMQVGDWLVSAGLSRYAPTFREKEICGEDLVTILGLGTDLSGPLLAEDLGVTSEADRVFLLRGFRINLEKAGACFLCKGSKPQLPSLFVSIVLSSGTRPRRLRICVSVVVGRSLVGGAGCVVVRLQTVWS